MEQRERTSNRQCALLLLFRFAKDSLHCLRRVALYNILRDCIGTANFTIHAGTTPWYTLLRDWIHLDQAKAHLPPIVPLEIVHQRPMHVATYRYSLTDGPMNHRKMF